MGDFFEEEGREKKRDAVQVPNDLREQVGQALSDRPSRSWDIALIGLLPEEDEETE